MKEIVRYNDFQLMFLALPALILYVFIGGCHSSRSWNPNEAGGYEQMELPTITSTKSGVAGDPLNVGLIAGAEELVYALIAAGWQPADAITLKSSVRIVKDIILKKSDPDAPVSNLYLWGRPQDIAFEKEVSGSPRQRHHVRLWLSDITVNGSPLWIGACSYDRGVYLRKFSHHIAPDVDAERAYLFGSLTNANLIVRLAIAPGTGRTDHGHNGEGDEYFTDGQLYIGWIKNPN